MPQSARVVFGVAYLDKPQDAPLRVADHLCSVCHAPAVVAELRAYGGKCENCYASLQAYQDNIAGRSRKIRTGQAINFHIHNSAANTNKTRIGVKW